VSLRARVAVGLGWTGGAHWFGVVTATVTTAVVARYLVPEDFAVVAAAGALAGVLGALQESGIAAAVVQHAGDGARAATTGLLLNLAGATAGFAVCLVLTPWLAAFFQIQEPAALAVAFSPLWLRAWMNVPLARLQKALDFRRCALVEAAQVLTYPALTIPLAVTGAGAWARRRAGAAGGGRARRVAALAWRPRLRDFDWETGRAPSATGARSSGRTSSAWRTTASTTGWSARARSGGARPLRHGVPARDAAAHRVHVRREPRALPYDDDAPGRRAPDARGVPARAPLGGSLRDAGERRAAPSRPTSSPWPSVRGGRRRDAAPRADRLRARRLLAATTGDVFKATGRSVLIFRIGLVHSVVLWTGLALLAPRGIAWTGLAVSIAATASGRPRSRARSRRCASGRACSPAPSRRRSPRRS
jgi:hypothetical protein